MEEARDEQSSQRMSEFEITLSNSARTAKRQLQHSTSSTTCSQCSAGLSSSSLFPTALLDYPAAAFFSTALLDYPAVAFLQLTSIIRASLVLPVYLIPHSNPLWCVRTCLTMILTHFNQQALSKSSSSCSPTLDYLACW